MTPRQAQNQTLHVVDKYCLPYRDVFRYVQRLYYFQLLHIGLLKQLPKPTLPAIAKAVGCNTQALRRFIIAAKWEAWALEEQHLLTIKKALRGRSFTLFV